MLTDDIAGIEALRQSPAIDVFAVASVLFELACARLPFGEKGAMPASPYRLKAEGAPMPAVMAHADAGTLDAVLSCEPDVAAAVDYLLEWEWNSFGAGCPTPASAALDGCNAGACAGVTPCLGLVRVCEVDKGTVPLSTFVISIRGLLV